MKGRRFDDRQCDDCDATRNRWNEMLMMDREPLEGHFSWALFHSFVVRWTTGKGRRLNQHFPVHFTAQNLLVSLTSFVFRSVNRQRGLKVSNEILMLAGEWKGDLSFYSSHSSFPRFIEVTRLKLKKKSESSLRRGNFLRFGKVSCVNKKIFTSLHRRPLKMFVPCRRAHKTRKFLRVP